MGLKGLPIKYASEPQPAFLSRSFLPEPRPPYISNCQFRFYRNPARRRLAIANYVSTGNLMCLSFP